MKNLFSEMENIFTNFKKTLITQSIKLKMFTKNTIKSHALRFYSHNQDRFSTVFCRFIFTPDHE